MFKHALTHDVAYNSLLLQRRRELHRLVAMAIEAVYAERLPEYYEMLAYHYELGEVWDKALEYLVKTGQRAQQAYANQEAWAHYNRALDVCAQLGAAVEPATLVTLLAGKGAVHFLLSEFAASVEAYQRMLEVTRQLGDRPKEAEALYQIGMSFSFAHEFEKSLEYADQARGLAVAIGSQNVLAGSILLIGRIQAVTGQLDQAARSYEESLTISREAGETRLEAFTLRFLGSIHNWQGEYDQALALEEQSIALAHTHNLVLILLNVYWQRGLALGGKGEYEAALAALMEGLALSERLGDKHWKCRLLNTLGWVYAELYNLELAIRYNQEGAEAAYPIGDPEIIRNAEINLGDCYMTLGDLARAQRYFEKVHHDSQQRGTWGEEWMKWRYSQHLYHSLGELWLTRGDADKALAFAEECLKLAEPTTSRKNLVKGWRLKGQAFGLQGRLPEADAALQHALTMATELGNPPQLWQTYQAVGELYEQEGEREQARAAYASAIRVIEGVAGRLQDQELLQVFLSAQRVQTIRGRFTQLHR